MKLHECKILAALECQAKKFDIEIYKTVDGYGYGMKGKTNRKQIDLVAHYEKGKVFFINPEGRKVDTFDNEKKAEKPEPKKEAKKAKKVEQEESEDI